MDYRMLEALPADAYLDPSNFVTVMDNPVKSAQQYKSALAVSERAETIYIGCNGVWGARMKDGASLSSYEGIGYHSNTAALLRGFLAGSAKIVVYRKGQQSPVVIKE